jgi:hypothetical protein
MAVYPQLGTGALTQFPISKTRRSRSVINTTADGSRIKLADPAGGDITWRLEYRDVSDAELQSLEEFFEEMEGALNAFTFVDPIANLLQETEDMSNSVWEAGPLLALSGGIQDPLGGTGAWKVANPAGGAQRLTQTLNSPGGYIYCFSVFVRATPSVTVTLLNGNQSAVEAVGSGWKRLTLAAKGDGTSNAVTFGIELPAGAAADVFGFQAEAQPGASGYKRGDGGGVYEGSRFRDDTFRYTTTGVNRNEVTVNIIYADHL